MTEAADEDFTVDALGHHHDAIAQLCQALKVDLAQTLAQLQALFARTDRRLEQRSANFDLPCRAGCSACCNAAVRITALEYLAVVEALRSAGELPIFLHRALAIDDDNGDLIHSNAAQQSCPALSAQGLCLAYAARPLVCRLFGHSFDDDDRLYACDLVGKHLNGKQVQLPRARPILQEIRALPLTEKVDSLAGFVRLFSAANP